MKKYILALDLGTTGNRAIVFDRKQKVVSSVYEEFPQIYPKAGWVEHDPEAIWSTVQRILKKTFSKVSPKDIAALGITNQRETVVVWNKFTGKPVMNAIVWQCRRTADTCAALKKRGLEKAVHQKTGLFLDPYFSATKIRWILDHVKSAKAQAAKGELLAGTIDSWIIWKLTGNKVHVTDSSNASRTLLFNIHTLKWDDSLCKVFGVPKKMLPDVAASSGVVALTDGQAAGAEIPIAGIIGDQQAASFAQGVFGHGIIKNTYGTGLFLLENTGRKPRFSKNLLTTVAWSLNDLKNTEYAVEGSVFVGGSAVQWLRDGLGIIKRSSEIEKLAQLVSHSDGVVFVPALVGLGAPYWDPKARGLLIGLTRGTKKAHIARAALEAIAFQTKDILDVMKKDTHQNFTRLRVDGGASADNLLMQIQADILNLPVERPVILETTALGAAAMAGLGCGFWKTRAELDRLRRVERVFKPKKGAASEKNYALWKKAVHRCLDWAN